jgi:hypothetical protein
MAKATTTKRRTGGDDGRRLVEKQARRERLVFRLLERRARWVAKQGRTTAAFGGEG